MPQTALDYLKAFRNDIQNKIASPIQDSKNKFIQVYSKFSLSNQRHCAFFFHYSWYSFSNIFVLCMIKHASKRNLVDKGAIVALKDKNLTNNF